MFHDALVSFAERRVINMKIIETLDKIVDEELGFYGNKAKNIWIMKKME